MLTFWHRQAHSALQPGPGYAMSCFELRTLTGIGYRFNLTNFPPAA